MEKHISHFKIREEIGSGGMGVVYRADDLRLRRKVALKVLPAGALADSSIRERLVREAQTASSLNHPHIVTVFEIHSAGDRDFIAMEYVEGRSLDHLIGDEGLPLDKALRYAIQIADGLGTAHEHGVIHRDLKPQNIMITPFDDVKILDFGLAKRFLPPIEDDSNLRPSFVTLTAPGVKVGTPAYMSPEQIESRTIDARSDVFSFGCLLYEMLTGLSPFHRRNAILIFKAVLSEEPEPVRGLRPQLPAELGRILGRAMQKAPADRYQSMHQLLADLERVQLERFGASIQASRSGVFPAPARPKKAGWRLAMPAAVALAAVSATLWTVSRPPDPPELNRCRRASGFQGADRQASLSPSAGHLAFVRDDATGVPRIWTRPRTGGVARRIAAAELPAEQPQWTPKGEHLIFAVRGDGIWSTRAGGEGEPTRILELGARPRLSSDGARLVIEHDGLLWLADADGTGLELVAAVPPAYFARWSARSPSFSPDGRSIAYFHPEVGSAGGLWVAPLPEGKPRRLFAASFRGGGPVWSADGRWIVFWGDLSGDVQLWSVASRGGSPRQLTRGPGSHTEPALSSDGRHLVFTWSNPSFALKRRSPVTGEETTLLESRFEIARPSVSPAGDRVAFAAAVGESVHLFTLDVAGGDVSQVTSAAGERNILPRWSADGSHLYFHQERPSASFRRVAAGGGDSTEVLASWRLEACYDTAVDAAGRQVVYTPLDAGSPGKLRVRELESGRERELGAALRSPRWSRDGGLILGSDPSDRIYLCPVSGSSCQYLADGFEPLWTTAGELIHFARRLAPSAPGDRSQKLSIRTLKLDDRSEREIARIDGSAPLVFGYAVLPGGDVVWNQQTAGPEELWMADLER